MRRSAERRLRATRRSPSAACWRGIAALVVLGILAGLVGLPLALDGNAWPHGHRAHASDSTTSNLVCLRAGPNDGEPLGNWVEFVFESRHPGATLALIYANGRYLHSFAEPSVVLTGGSTRTFAYAVDTTYFANGPLTLEFLFLSNTGATIGTARVRGIVDNPRLNTPPQDEVDYYGVSRVSYGGRVGDGFFVLEAGQPSCLQTPPDRRTRCSAEILVRGSFNSGSLTREIVLDLYTVSRLQSSGMELVLWTYHPDRGWGRSAVKPPVAVSSASGSSAAAPARSVAVWTADPSAFGGTGF